MESQTPWLIAAVLSAMTAVAGWVARGGQRTIAQEGAWSRLHRDAVEVVRVQQDVTNALSEEVKTVRRELTTVLGSLQDCMVARDQAKIERAQDRVSIQIERAQDRVKMAQLEEEIVRLRVHINASDARTDVLEAVQ